MTSDPQAADMPVYAENKSDLMERQKRQGGGMSFEGWWTDQYNGAPAMVFNTEEAMAEAAYTAGVQAERERCARLAETHRDAGCVVSVSGQTIAAAIRGQG